MFWMSRLIFVRVIQWADSLFIWYSLIFYSLNKKEWICSLFKEWILEKSEIRVNLEWTFVLFTHFGVTSGSLGIIHPKFTLISLFSKIHSLKSEHIHSFLFREYISLLLSRGSGVARIFPVGGTNCWAYKPPPPPPHQKKISPKRGPHFPAEQAGKQKKKRKEKKVITSVGMGGGDEQRFTKE